MVFNHIHLFHVPLLTCNKSLDKTLPICCIVDASFSLFPSQLKTFLKSLIKAFVSFPPSAFLFRVWYKWKCAGTDLQPRHDLVGVADDVFNRSFKMYCRPSWSPGPYHFKGNVKKSTLPLKLCLYCLSETLNLLHFCIAPAFGKCNSTDIKSGYAAIN